MKIMVCGQEKLGAKARLLAILGGALLSTGLGVGVAKAATLGNPFPAAENLSQDEITQISAAFEQALGQAKPGTVVVWKSSDSGRTGQVRVLRGWDAEGGHCVELEQRFSKGDKAVYQVPYCQGQDGTWKITF
jgi:hypothetical protein